MQHSSKIEHKIHQKDGREIAFSAPLMEKVQKIIARYPAGKQKSALIPLLHIAQEEFGGYLSVDTMDYVASLLKITPIEVSEVATFYTQFFVEKNGKYVIEVCRTGPCAICGGEDLAGHIAHRLGIHDGETTADGMFTLRTVECLGACGYAPAMQVNTEFYEKMTAEKADQVLEMLKGKASEEKPQESKWEEKFF